MTTYHKSCLIALLVVAVLSLRVPAAEAPADVPLRMANGTVIEGTMQEATPDGLVIQGEKGQYTAPWKHLSAGTRYRYELAMLAAQATAASNALPKAQAAAVGKTNAATKVTATKATGTNTAGVVSSKPPAKK